MTEGKPKVVDFYFNPELDGKSFRNTLVAMEKQSNHPLANAIVNKFEIQKVDYDIKVERTWDRVERNLPRRKLSNC